MNWEFRDEAAVFEELGRQFEFPSTYLVLDCETTGFSKAKDFMIDAGWAVVHENRIVNHTSMLLNWALVPGVDCDFIRSQLQRQQTDYARQGRPHYYPWERLVAEGVHPMEVIHAYSTLIFEHIKNPDSMIVGHGLWRFDREVIDSHTQRFLQGYLLPWQRNTIIDTGLLEKAAQMGARPWSTDTLDDWMRRTNNAFSKVKWNLENHCVPKYRLVEQNNLDMRLMHTAGFDCVLIHLLFQKYRQLTEMLNGKRQSLTP